MSGVPNRSGPGARRGDLARTGSHFALLLLSLLVIFVTPIPLSAEESSPAQLLWIKGGRLIDGTGRPPMHRAWILIRGDEILRVGPPGSFPRPAGARVLRAAGLTILPGLIDAHVHLKTCGVVGSTFRRRLERDEGFFFRNLRAELLGGVTLVRDLHIQLQMAQRLDAAVRQDPTRGASLVYAGPILTAPGGYGSPFGVQVGTPEEGKTAVDGLLQEGAGVVKIAVTSRQLSGAPVAPMAADVARAIVEAAHARGVPVAAHVAGATEEDLRAAVEAGVDSLEHLPGVYDPMKLPDTLYSSSGQIAAIRARGIAVVPTLSVEAGEDFGPTIPGLASDQALRLRLTRDQRGILAENLDDFARNPRRQAIAVAGKERFRILLQEVGWLHRSGIRIAAGTDAGSGFTFHGNVHTEIEYLHQAGLTPLEAIVAATSTNASLLRMANRVGTLEEGKLANLLLVRGDPLEDLGALRAVERVIIAGRVIDVHRLLKETIRDETREQRRSAP